jgi:hypothetical protein
MEISGLDGIRSCGPMFFSNHWVSEVMLRSSIVCYHYRTFMFHGDVRGEEYHGNRDMRTSNGDSSLGAIRNFLGDS